MLNMLPKLALMVVKCVAQGVGGHAANIDPSAEYLGPVWAARIGSVLRPSTAVSTEIPTSARAGRGIVDAIANQPHVWSCARRG